MTTILDLELLTEARAAQALGLKPRTLRECRRRGEIAFRRIGKQVRYTRSDLAEFVERQRQIPPRASGRASGRACGATVAPTTAPTHAGYGTLPAATRALAQKGG